MATAKPVKEDKSKLEIPPDGAPVQVTETQKNDDGTTITKKYEATVKPNDNAEDNADSEADAYDFEDEDFEAFTQAPKTAIEKMFDRIRDAVTFNGIDDYFYANVQRLPDPMRTNYNVPCSLPTDLGSFQFSSRDFFDFKAALQKLNGNSGGLFNVNIYKLDGTPLEVEYRRPGGLPGITAKVFLTNYSVPNPPAQPREQGNENNQNNEFREYMRRTDERFSQMFAAMNKPKEPSALERAMEQKIIHDLTNPPVQRDGTDAITQTLATIIATPVMVERMSAKLFPDPPAPAEPSTFDYIDKAMNWAPAQNLLNGLVNVSEQFAAQKFAEMAKKNGTDNTVDAEEFEDDDEMKVLTANLITELESDRPLDATNEFLTNLDNDYPEHGKMIRKTCKALNFDGTLAMLIQMTDEIQPHPFLPFLDVEATQKESKYIFNERGNKLKERLEQFYNFARTS